jgi:hypothetical protein
MKSNDHRESHGRIHSGLQPAIKRGGVEHMHTDEVVVE